MPLERTRFGVYELLHEIGRGGMAELYLARVHGWAGFERWVAIKRILPHLAHDKLFVDMFVTEGQITALLDHRNICSVFDLCKAGDELLLVMEYLYGVTWDALAKVMPRDATGLRLAAGVLAQACDGLHYAHTRCDAHGQPFHIVHRDVSPQNLLVTAQGECKVLDFGVAKIATARTHTRTGVLKGKVPYMSPEQLEGAPLDARSDVWALGVVLWEALAGRRLFDRETEFTSWKAITEEDVPPVGGPYPPAIDAVIAHALARDRTHRFASAAALGTALRDVAREVGGALDADAIGAFVRTHCAPQLAERDRELAAATTKRDASASHADAAPPPEPAETVSMLMRRDSVVIARPLRRWWPLALGAGALAAIAALVIATRSGDAPAQPAATAPALAARDTPHDTPRGESARDTPPATSTRDTPPTSTRASTHMGAGESNRASTHDMRAGESTRAATGDTPPATATATRASTHDMPPAASTRVSTHDMPRATATRASTRTSTGDTPAASTRASTGDTPAALTRASTGDTPAGDSHRAAAGRAPAAATGTGTYAVDSTPYATIYIDGKLIGDTPLDRVAVPAGSHMVKAVLADGRHRSFAIEIAADRKTSSGMLAW